MNIGFFGKSVPPDIVPAIQQSFGKLIQSGCKLSLFEPFHQNLKRNFSVDIQADMFSSHADIEGRLDCLISIGGDGTMLDTITLVRDSGIPILGVNMGRMGFLSSVAREEMEQAFDALMEKRFVVDQRTLIRLESPAGLFGELNYALNEVAVYKKEPNSMLSIHTYVDDIFLNSYWADGLIIATPTGSTAYSLSCGGPIVLPGSQNLIITPIATHNLTVRPIVIPDKSVIRLQVEDRRKGYCLSLDSRSKVLNSIIEIVVVKEDFKINLIRMENQNFFRTIREKLKWGLDIRNYPKDISESRID
jgi:NAD+ kinase